MQNLQWGGLIGHLDKITDREIPDQIQFLRGSHYRGDDHHKDDHLCLRGHGDLERGDDHRQRGDRRCRCGPRPESRHGGRRAQHPMRDLHQQGEPVSAGFAPDGSVRRDELLRQAAG